MASSPHLNAFVPSPHGHPSDLAWMFRLEAVREPPMIDLRRNLLQLCFSTATEQKCFDIFRKHYKKLTACLLISLLASISDLYVEAQVGQYLALLFIPFTLITPTMSILLYSRDILVLLAKSEYEFWFFTALNLGNWVIAALIFNEMRSIILLIGLISGQLVVFIDANFRTIKHATKFYLLLSPILLIIAISVYLEIMGLRNMNYFTIRIGQIDVKSSDLLLNLSTTLTVFIARKSYLKHKHIKTAKRSNNENVLRCVILRSKLRVRKADTKPSLAHRDKNETKSYGNFEASGLQRLSLAFTSVGVFDGRHIMIRSILQQLCQSIEGWQIIMFHSLGIFSGLLTMVALATRHPDASRLVIQSVNISAFVLTIAYCSVYLACTHRRLLRALYYNFDFLFTWLQFLMMTALLIDANEWGYKTFGLAAWGIWFHWVVTFDAVLPPFRRQLKIAKRGCLAVVLVTMLYIAMATYVIVFTDSRLSRYSKRILFSFTLNSKEISFRMDSLLLSRLVTGMLWNFKLVYEYWCAPEEELVFLKGSLQYYNPLETFPVKEIMPAKVEPINTLDEAELDTPVMPMSPQPSSVDGLPTL